jgi:hypothetical protein
VRGDRIGIVTVPRVEITFYNFNGVHGFDSCAKGRFWTEIGRRLRTLLRDFSGSRNVRVAMG